MKKIVLLAVLLPLMSVIAQVGVGTNAPHASSILDVESTDRGFLPPRLASDGAVSGPAEGLVIYDETDDCLNVFNGSEWVNFCGSSGNGNGNDSSVFYAWETGLRFADVMTPVNTNNQNETTVGLGLDGNIYAWGHDNDGVIQNFDPNAAETDTSNSGTTTNFLPSPWKLSDPRYDGEVKKFVSFEGRYVVLTNSGELYVFGDNQDFFIDSSISAAQELIKPRLKDSPVPGTTFSDIKVNNVRTTALLSDGSAHFWGRDHDGSPTGSTGWRTIAPPSTAGAGFEYTEILDVNQANANTIFLKGNDNKVYVSSAAATLRGSNGSASGSRSLTNGAHMYELQFPAGAGEIVKIQSSGTTAVAFDDAGNSYGWGRYARRATTSPSSAIEHLNFVVDASQTPVTTTASLYTHIVDPVLLALPAGETGFVSFSKDTSSNDVNGSFFVGESGKTYFIGNSEASSVESANLFDNGATSLDYVQSVSAAHVNAAEISHESGYVGILDKNGAWYFFGESDIVNIGGFNTPLLNSANLSGTANFSTPLAQPLQQGILDSSNLRPFEN